MTETKIVDNRVLLLGLDELYREAMKRCESGELLRCAQVVAKRAGVQPANVPIEGYYGEEPELTEYFRLMRGLQSYRAGAGADVDSLTEFRRLYEVCTSPIFGEAQDEGMLLPVGRDSLSRALRESSEWTIPNLVEAACRFARETDDISLVGLAARARDEVVLAAVRESTVLYAEWVPGAAMNPPVPKYIWKVDEEIERAARKFVDTFNGLVGAKLPMPRADAAKAYWLASRENGIGGRCVRIGSDPTTDPVRHYHWAIRYDRFGKLGVEEFWSEEIWTTDRYRKRPAPPPDNIAEILANLRSEK
jgi:hypothetical protein